jgi:predicted alpha/beta hydrolase family esterase
MKTKEMNCIVIHGCPSNAERVMDPKTRTYDKHWIPWIKKEFEKYNVTKNTILIGHSCGCAFLVRWLGETKQKVNKLILVAPWKIPDKKEEDIIRWAIWEQKNSLNYWKR